MPLPVCCALTISLAGLGRQVVLGALAEAHVGAAGGSHAAREQGGRGEPGTASVSPRQSATPTIFTAAQTAACTFTRTCLAGTDSHAGWLKAE